jgi:hypothetical protein
MKIGDVVKVRITGQRARIVAERSGYFTLEYLPDVSDDPMDRELSRVTEPAGMYREQDLDVAE